MICDAIQKLMDYGLQNDLIQPEDRYVVQNQYMEIFQLSDWQTSGEESSETLRCNAGSSDGLVLCVQPEPELCASGRIAKDLKWTYASEYGTLDITINRSKSEKDPRDIATAKSVQASAYPKCQLCPEMQGLPAT